MHSLPSFWKFQKSSTPSVLANAAYARYWFAGLAANFGWQVQTVAAAWLMLTLGASPVKVALVQTAVALPVMLFSLPGGAMSDIMGQRSVVIWSQAFLLAVSGTLAVCAYTEVLSPTVILICVFLLGSGRATYYPGWQAMVLQLVEPEQVPKGVALSAGSVNIARSLGPAFGGTIVATWGAFSAFVLAGFGNLAVMLVAGRWPRSRNREDLPLETLSGAIVGGIRYVALTPHLVVATARSMIYNAGAISALALLPLVARDTLGGGPQVYGTLLGAFGVGAVMGALALGGLTHRLGTERLLFVAQAGAAMATFGLAVSESTVLAATAAFVAGSAWTCVQVSFNATVQLTSPRWVVNRSLAIYQATIFGGNAFGSWVWGLLAERFDLGFALIGAAVLMATGSLAGLRFKIAKPRAGALDQTPREINPGPRLRLDPLDGPIVASIGYKIREEDVSRFVNAMATKRRYRMRDGAMRWTLSRDIHDPELWFERFHVGTWADAQRLHARRTVETAEANALVRSMHLGADAPQVHYTLVSLPRRRGESSQGDYQGISI